MRIYKKIITLIFFLLLVYSIYSVPKLIVIDSINCKSQFGPCNQSIEVRLGNVVGKSLRLAKSEAKHVLQNEPVVNDFNIQFKLPDKLEVSIVTSKPRFAIKNESQPLVALVDNNGLVLSLVDITNLPTLIVGDSIPNSNERVLDEVLFALFVLSDVYSTYQVDRALIENERLVIELNDGLEVIFPLEGDRQVLVGSLILIQSKLNRDDENLKIEGKAKVSSLDLRFENPILK